MFIYIHIYNYLYKYLSTICLLKIKIIDMFLPPCNTVAIMKGHREVPNQETSPKADSQC